MRSLQNAIIVSFLILLVSVAAQSQTLNAADEDRAQRLFGELRCVVCQNQSIADSDAEVARDLRQLVREQIGAGSSNRDVKSFLVSRYGEFVLLKPDFAPHTYFLWFSPFLMLLLGLFWIVRGRSNAIGSEKSLSEEEEKALDDILSK